MVKFIPSVDLVRSDSIYSLPSQDHEYVDDFPFKFSSYDALQRKLVMASAAATLMGLTVSPKSKFYLFDYSGAAPCPLPLTLHAPVWDSFSIPLSENLLFKYLA
jgi:hypothetical protein